MKPTILRGEMLMWVRHLVSDGREEAERGLSAADRWAVESVVGTACQDQVALDKYLHALQEEIGNRPAGTDTGLDDPATWDALFRNGLSVLSDSRLLAVAESAETIRELNARVGAALTGGTLAVEWHRYPKVMADRMSEAEIDQLEPFRFTRSVVATVPDVVPALLRGE
ncbi:MAG: hypothetical protein K2X87_30330, partial [Gemmataceae bacterium]|nr:hypothetical protein [Gemmataceae bacterium]